MTTGAGKRARTLGEWVHAILLWVAVAFFVLTLPLSFPMLAAYKAWHREKWRGKGAGFIFILWVGMTALWALLIVAYVNKGWAGLRTLFYIGLAGIVWTCVVMAVFRVIVEAIALVVKIRRWFDKRSK
ncbi:MAG: hypothetical protein IPM54_01905 [Polyangiaceae bacterium]|nr:hypothetical protein [Polyangiaceae bacterium]